MISLEQQIYQKNNPKQNREGVNIYAPSLHLLYEKKVSYFFSPKFLFVLVMLNNA